jgi:CheY-like chemotaxis protein
VTAATLLSREGRLAGFLVLVAEDDPDSRNVLRQVLTFEGAAVRLAENGAAALRILERSSRRPDLLLIDLMMPLLNGIQFAHRVGTDARWQDIPMVALTARTGAADYHATLQAGFAAHMAKPFEVDDLVGTIQRVVRLHLGSRGRLPGPHAGMTRPRVADGRRDELSLVEELAQIVADAAVQFEAAGAPSSAIRALHQVGDVLRLARPVRDQAHDPNVVSIWRHAVRGHVSAVAGWAQVYQAAPDDARRALALDGFKRSIVALHRRLAE